MQAVNPVNDNAYAAVLEVQRQAVLQSNLDIFARISEVMAQNNQLRRDNEIRAQAIQALQLNQKPLQRLVNNLKKGFFCKLAKLAGVVAVIAVVIICIL